MSAGSVLEDVLFVSRNSLLGGKTYMKIIQNLMTAMSFKV